MASLDYRLNPLFTIKECSSCGSLYNKGYCCTPDSSQQPLRDCPKCGNPVEGLNCQGCTLWRKKLKEVWFTICHENGIYQDLLNTYESSDDDTNVVNTPREPFVIKQDPGENSSQSPLQINHNCCYECGDSLDGIFCQQCTCKSCGKGAHYGYNCPPQIPIISNPEPCYNQNLDEILQNLQSLQQQCLLGTCQQCGCNEYDGVCFYYTVGNGTPINFSTPYSSNDSPNFANHLLQPQYVPYHCELCGNDAHHGYDCPPQFPVNYPLQEINKEIKTLQRSRLNGSYTKLFRSYDQYTPNEKCMDLLLAEERFLKIKQAMEEEQNQPGVMQELLLKLIDDLQILKGSQQEKEETAAQSFTPYWNFSMIEVEDVEILFAKLKDALTGQAISTESTISEYTIIYSKPKAITPDLSIEEPDNSLNMEDEHLDTISSVENLVPIPSNDHSEILSDSNNDDTSSDDNSYENIEYIEASPLNLEYDSLEDVNEDQEEKEFDLEDIFQIQDVILREKLLNISHLVTNIKSLKDNPTPDYVFKSPSSFPIPVVDSDSFLEESDTSLSHLDNSLPEFKTFSDHTEETRSGSTTTHANNSVPEYDSFLFEVEPNQGGLTGIVISDNSNNPLLELLEFESFHFDLDPSFPRPPPEPPDVEISLIIETNAPVINDFDELNGDECFDPWGGETNFEVDNSFTFIIWTFLPFFTYPEDSHVILSLRNEDLVFDPGISTFHFSLKSVPFALPKDE
ncbi:hypothetical protein Tco_1042881 [Tanacetum coccineum]|uniref:CCHC-type domain-containing protein n=1 Tax=Tanacetum coccineum TaxID=301880 RepID=A0ABQ5GKE8_9ASTR